MAGKMRGKKTLGLLLSLILILSLSACSLPHREESRLLAIDEKGQVTETIAEKRHSQDTYSEKDLQDYIEDQLITYQGTKKGAVRLDSLSVHKDTVHIVMKYDSMKDFAGFNHSDAFLGTIKEAEDAGYSFDRPLKDKLGRAADPEELQSRRSEWQALILSEETAVRLYDKILYASEEVRITGRLYASVGDPKERAQAEGKDRYLTGTIDKACIIFK